MRIGLKNFGGAGGASFPTRLLDLFVQRVALQKGIVFLFLNPLRDGLLVALGEVARNGFTLFTGFCAFECDGFLHGLNGLKGRKQRVPPHLRNSKV